MENNKNYRIFEKENKFNQKQRWLFSFKPQFNSTNKNWECHKDYYIR